MFSAKHEFKNCSNSLMSNSFNNQVNHSAGTKLLEHSVTDSSKHFKYLQKFSCWFKKTASQMVVLSSDTMDTFPWIAN